MRDDGSAVRWRQNVSGWVLSVNAPPTFVHRSGPSGPTSSRARTPPPPGSSLGGSGSRTGSINSPVSIGAVPGAPRRARQASHRGQGHPRRPRPSAERSALIRRRARSFPRSRPRFIEQLHEYEFGSFFDEALKISREDYRPRREDWRPSGRHLGLGLDPRRLGLPARPPRGFQALRDQSSRSPRLRRATTAEHGNGVFCRPLATSRIGWERRTDPLRHLRRAGPLEPDAEGRRPPSPFDRRLPPPTRVGMMRCKGFSGWLS